MDILEKIAKKTCINMNFMSIEYVNSKFGTDTGYDLKRGEIFSKYTPELEKIRMEYNAQIGEVRNQRELELDAIRTKRDSELDAIRNQRELEMKEMRNEKEFEEDKWVEEVCALAEKIAGNNKLEESHILTALLKIRSEI